MISKLRKVLFFVVALALPTLVMAQTQQVVIAPELPTGFDFDVTVLFDGLLGILLPAVAAAIGLAATIGAVSLIWRKVRDVGA
jgi:hypothetical protein